MRTGIGSCSMHCARALLRAFQKEPVSSSHSRCLRDPLASLVRGHSSPSNSAKASDCLLSVFALPKVLLILDTLGKLWSQNVVANIFLSPILSCRFPGSRTECQMMPSPYYFLSQIFHLGEKGLGRSFFSRDFVRHLVLLSAEIHAHFLEPSWRSSAGRKVSMHFGACYFCLRRKIYVHWSLVLLWSTRKRIFIHENVPLTAVAMDSSSMSPSSISSLLWALLTYQCCQFFFCGLHRNEWWIWHPRNFYWWRSSIGGVWREGRANPSRQPCWWQRRNRLVTCFHQCRDGDKETIVGISGKDSFLAIAHCSHQLMPIWVLVLWLLWHHSDLHHTTATCEIIEVFQLWDSFLRECL